VEQLRRFKPEVVVTHDTNGEYGHGAHKTCADLMLKCIPMAAGTAKFTDSLNTYGAWEVKKLYLHLYPENAVEMDWDQPLSAFNGKTSYEMAVEGYNWHFSQHDQGQKNKETGEFEYFIVEPRDSDYSCYRFGLAHTYTDHYTKKPGGNSVTDSDIALDFGLLYHYDFACGISWNTEITYTPLIDDLEKGIIVHETKWSYLMKELGLVSDKLTDVALEAGIRNEYQTQPEPGTNHTDTTWYLRLSKSW
jgi:hypothetical protein